MATAVLQRSVEMRHSCGARKIVLARRAGFCFGVRRAVDITLRVAASGASKLTTLGPVVHNEQVTQRLRASGVGFAKTVDEIDGGTLVISAHGVSTGVREVAKSRGLALLDVTCPYVTKVHRAARQLFEQGYQILLVGDKGHTEVLGVVGAVDALGGRVHVVSDPMEVAALDLGRKVGVLSQTTQYATVFVSVVAEVCRRVQDVRAINTVCGATEELQEAAAEMAAQVDVAIVIGGRSSANSRRLREICAVQGIPAYQIETADEIEEEWLEGRERIGLTAGASTPDWAIEDVARRLNFGQLPDDWCVHHPDEE